MMDSLWYGICWLRLSWGNLKLRFAACCHKNTKMYVSLCVGVHSMKEKGFHASLIVSGHRMGSPSLLLIVMATSLCMGWGPASLMNRYLIHSLTLTLTQSPTLSLTHSLTHLSNKTETISYTVHTLTHTHTFRYVASTGKDGCLCFWKWDPEKSTFK